MRETGANNAIYYRGINIIAQRAGANLSYYLRDAHGDTIGLAASTGVVVKEYKHDAFGNLACEYGTTTETPFRYNGQYTDDETGLIYLRNRYYDPSIGRFTQEDPAKDGLNWYVYCDNDPVNFVDPWGLKPWDRFSSADEAAKDFGLYIGQQSIDMNEETASYIYVSLDENGDVYYTYDIPRNDKPTHNEKINSFSISPSKDDALTVDSVAHSHGAYDANTENVKDIFSTPDNVDADRAEYSDTYQSDITDRDYYLVSPNGKLVKYEANSGEYEGELISSDMIVDERIGIYKQLKNTLIFNLIKQSFPKATDADIVEARKSNKDSWLGTLNSLERFR